MTRLALDTLVPAGAYLESRIDRVEGTSSGERWGHLLEIEFEDLEHEEEFFDNHLQAYWSGPPLRDWRQLEGFRIMGDQRVVDTLYYAVEFETAKETSVFIGERDGTSFHVEVRAHVDLPYLDNFGQFIAVDLWVPFSPFDHQCQGSRSQ